MKFVFVSGRLPYGGVFATSSGWVFDRRTVQRNLGKGKGKAIPLQAWSGPEGSRKLKFPDFTTTAQGGGKFVSLKHRTHLLPGNPPDTHFCQVLIRP